MLYATFKVILTSVLVVAVSEAAKRSALVGAIIASVPLVSVLAMIWLYSETRDAAQVAALARSVFWLVLPSLVLFVTLPLLLSRGVNFYMSLAAAVAATVGAYYLMIVVGRPLGLKL